MMEGKGRSVWTLFLLGCIYTFGELGHFILGTISRNMAQDIHFGDKACLKSNHFNFSINSDICSAAKNETQCEDVTTLVGEVRANPCTWDYNGLGLEYHILAGPAFIAMFTVSAIGWGCLADKFNRVRCLTVATLIFTASIVGTAFSTKYWHVFLFRMALAAGESGCSPLATGIIADLFHKRHRGLAMGLFHWGIYIGYGSSFTIGNYVTKANIWNKGWRASYVLSGLPGILVAVVFLLTAKEPSRTDDNDNRIDDEKKSKSKKSLSITSITIPSLSKVNILPSTTCLEGLRIGWKTVSNPAIVFLLLGACVRHAGGYCWGYNSALYFKTYYPDYDVSWWLTGISIGAGALGVLFGGFLSDTLVNKLGISARALVLAISQLIASPFTFGQFFLDPPYALYALLGGYLAAEMWFGVMFAVLIELVPSDIRSKAVAIALFCINNVGGNTPVIVDPIAHAFDYRTAIIILYPGALFTSSMLFFICWAILRSQGKKEGIINNLKVLDSSQKFPISVDRVDVKG